MVLVIRRRLNLLDENFRDGAISLFLHKICSSLINADLTDKECQTLRPLLLQHAGYLGIKHIYQRSITQPRVAPPFPRCV